MTSVKSSLLFALLPVFCASKKFKAAETKMAENNTQTLSDLGNVTGGVVGGEEEDFAVEGGVFGFVTEGLLIFIIGLLGLVGNAISIWTFSRQRVHRIFHNLLLVLALFDIVSFNCKTPRTFFSHVLETLLFEIFS